MTTQQLQYMVCTVRHHSRMAPSAMKGFVYHVLETGPNTSFVHFLNAVLKVDTDVLAEDFGPLPTMEN